MNILLIAFYFLLTMDICCAAELQPHIHREWQFPVDDGTVIFTLTGMNSSIDDQAIYSLQINTRKVEPTLLTEIEFFKSVIRDMEKESIPPQRITDIILELREPDVSKQLSVAAYNSKIWTESKKADFGKAVVKLLNSIGAYAPFNQIFNQYGLEVEVSHAEYISVIKPEQIGLKSNTVSFLPSNATLVLTLKRLTPVQNPSTISE